MGGPQDVAGINRQIEQLIFRLEEQGSLDAQFKKILQLPDESNPNFVPEVVELFVKNTEKNLSQMQGYLQKENPEFEAISQLLILMKGSNETFGARALTDLCVQFQDECKKKGIAECRMILGNQEEELRLLKRELTQFLELFGRKKELLAGAPKD